MSVLSLRFLSGITAAASIMLPGSHTAGSFNSHAGAPASAYSWLRAGHPKLQSADVLTFSPDGVLFVGDSRGSAVFAMDAGDSGWASDSDVQVADIGQKIAARLGTTEREIIIHDMAVHPKSHNVYFSVSRGRQADHDMPVLVRVAHDGQIDVIQLASLPFAKVELPRPLKPEDATGPIGRNWTISDMAVVGNELFVAGLSNEEFSSTMRRIPLPFNGKVATAGLRLYHSHHFKYETQAPATAIAPYTVSGRTYLVASYGCTPVVLFPIDSLKGGAKVTGKTIAELGAGQNVRDLFTFEHKGQRYLVASNRRRSPQLFDATDLSAGPALDEHFSLSHPKAEGVSVGSSWGLPNGFAAQTGIMHFADFDANYTIAAQRDIETGALNLRLLTKPFLGG